MSQMFSEFLASDVGNGGLGDFGGDSGLADVFGSLQDLMKGMGGFSPPDTAGAGPGAGPGADAGAEAAGKLFAELFEGDGNPFAAFMGGAGDATSVMASFLGSGAGGSASGGSRAAQPGGLASLLGSRGSSLGSLFGGSLFGSAAHGSSDGSGGSSSGSASVPSTRSATPSPFADLLQPVSETAASTRVMMGQLAAAIKQADVLLQAPDVGDLFGGGGCQLSIVYVVCMCVL